VEELQHYFGGAELAERGHYWDLDRESGVGKLYAGRLKWIA
jgi:hypothetical protein